MMIIHGIASICSAWFLDIRISTSYTVAIYTVAKSSIINKLLYVVIAIVIATY